MSLCALLQFDSLLDGAFSPCSSVGSVTWRERQARQARYHDASVKIDATLDALLPSPSSKGGTTESAVTAFRGVQPNHGPVTSVLCPAVNCGMHETASSHSNEPSGPALWSFSAAGIASPVNCISAVTSPEYVGAEVDAVARQLEKASYAAGAASRACRTSTNKQLAAATNDLQSEVQDEAGSPVGTTKRVGSAERVGTAERYRTASGSSRKTAPQLTVKARSPANILKSTRAIAAVTEDDDDDEFAWRKRHEPDDGEGQIDDRVEGAIEQINVCRDAMNQAQIGLDAATSKLIAQDRLEQALDLREQVLAKLQA